MTAILTNIFENSIGISVIILVLFIFRGIIGKRYTSRWQYWVWVILTFRLILPFDIPIALFEAPLEINVANPVIYQKPLQSDGEGTAIISPEQQKDNETEYSDKENVIIRDEDTIYDRNIFEYTAGLMKRSSIALSDILCFVWICGGVLLLCIRLGSYMIARASLMKTLVPYEIDMSFIQHKLGIGGEVEVFTSYMVTTPVLTGVINPKIIIPEDSVNDLHLQLALYHELVHYKRCDIGVKLLLFAATCAYWYNPCVWLMNKLAMEDIEFSCDETIYRQMNAEGKGLYGESILKFAAKKKESLLYSTSFSNDKKTTANRIKNIFNDSVKRTSAVAIAVIVVFAMLSGSLVACTTEKASEETVPDSNTVLEIGPEDDTALYIINLYEKYSLGRDYDSGDSNLSYHEQENIKYENIRPVLWGILEDGDFEEYKDYYKDGSGEYQYVIPNYEYLASTEILFNARVFDGDPNTIGCSEIIFHPNEYSVATKFGNGYEVDLIETGKRMLENGDIVYSFERRHNNEIVGYVEYTLTPVTVPVMPEILSQHFKDNSTLYSITKVKGSQEPPQSSDVIIELSTPEDLIQMSNDYAENGHKYANYTYVLINDIDMSGVTDFLPIGRNKKISYDERDSSENGFSSVFDGNGYTIKNLTIEDTQDQYYGQYYLGLFAEISIYGTVKNVNVENIHITTHNVSGGFAGKISGRVENCHVNGRIDTIVSAGGFAGSIYGYNSTTVKNCSADVDIYGESMIAGFVANTAYSGYENMEVQYVIENCTSYGSLNSDKLSDRNYSYHENPNTIGGFVGRAITGNFINCHVQTPIHLNHTSNMVGSFAAISENVATFTNCTYNPATAGSWYLIGTFEGKNSNGDYRGFEFTEAVK